MSDQPRSVRFPRGPLIGAAIIIVIAISAASAGRLGLFGIEQSAEAQMVVSRDLRFEDRSDGRVAVVDIADEQPIEIFGPGEGGFIRATMRGMARDRRSQGIGPEPPFRLTLWDNGRLSLEDLSTGRTVALDAFGAMNAEVFAGLLSVREGTQ